MKFIKQPNPLTNEKNFMSRLIFCRQLIKNKPLNLLGMALPVEIERNYVTNLSPASSAFFFFGKQRIL